jgi:CheY-like chemotaxis protein
MNEQLILAVNEEIVTQTFTALIVDDEIFNRRLFQLTLEVAGYKIYEAENGLHGLNILNHESFNVLILDLAMPYIDGLTVIKTIRRKSMHDRMRIVVVTANAHLARGEVDELADFVMHKPIDVIAFRNFVQRLKDDPRASYCPTY